MCTDGGRNPPRKIYIFICSDIHQQVGSALHMQSQPFSQTRMLEIAVHSGCDLPQSQVDHLSRDDASQSHAALNNSGLMNRDVLEYW